MNDSDTCVFGDDGGEMASVAYASTVAALGITGTLLNGAVVLGVLSNAKLGKDKEDAMKGVGVPTLERLFPLFCPQTLTISDVKLSPPSFQARR